MLPVVPFTAQSYDTVDTLFFNRWPFSRLSPTSQNRRVQRAVGYVTRHVLANPELFGENDASNATAMAVLNARITWAARMLYMHM